MRAPKGINIVRLRRKSGATYQAVYAWRAPNAPRLYSQVGTPEFLEEYRIACEARRRQLDAMVAPLTQREMVFMQKFAGPILHRARLRSATKNREFQLSKTDLLRLFREQEGRCAVSGILFDLHNDKKNGCAFNAYTASLDRINYRAGYTLNNVRLVLFAVNAAINQWGDDTFFTIASAVTRKNAQKTKKPFATKMESTMDSMAVKSNSLQTEILKG